jgi:hypothetical protein
LWEVVLKKNYVNGSTNASGESMWTEFSPSNERVAPKILPRSLCYYA